MNKSRYFSILFSITLLAIFTSCGDSSDNNNPVNPDGESYTEINEETVSLSLQAVEHADSIYKAYFENGDRESAVTEALDFLLSSQLVKTASIEADSSITVNCSNGIIISFAGSTWERSSILGETSSRVIDTNAYDGGEVTPSAVILAPSNNELYSTALGQISDDIDQCLGGPEASSTEIITNADVTVDKVMEVLESGTGLIYWIGHGSLVDGVCHLLTGETFDSEEMLQKAIGDYNDGLAPGDGGSLLSISKPFYENFGKWKVRIAPAFVQRYGNFDVLEDSGYNQVKSIAYISCCHSAAGMKEAFLGAGVDTYFGWTWAVEDAWAASFDGKMISSMCDTATVKEALKITTGEYGNTCPAVWKGNQASASLSGDKEIMVRAQMRLSKDGAQLHGFSVMALEGSPHSVSCFAGDDITQIQYSLSCSFPDQGTWNCVTDEDAVIMFVEMNTNKLFIVQKDYVGVDGTIEVTDFSDDKTAGKFNGTLGNWTTQNPEENPPAETITITDGFFKYTGARQ